MNTNPNVVLNVERAFVSNVPAAPANDATTVLFATHPCTLSTGGASVQSAFVRGGGEACQIAADSMEEVDLTFGLHNHASAANGLLAYYTNDGGTTWTETDMKGNDNTASIGAAAPIQVPTLAPGAEWSEKFVIGRYRGFAVTYTAGATGPTAGTGWDVTVAVKYAPQGK